MTRPPDTPARPAIAVLARAPVPGQAKTRLMPLLGAEGAAQLQQWLLRRTLATAQAAGLGPVVLCCAPDTSHPEFGDCAARFGVQLRPQAAGDLGARMLHAAAAAMAPDGVLIVGTDCPALSGAHLRAAAARLLDGDDTVLIPAEDGGYVMIGLRAAEPAPFEGVDWGGPEVMAQTRRRLAGAGLRWSELPTLWDVDRPDDFARLLALEPALNRLLAPPGGAA